MGVVGGGRDGGDGGLKGGKFGGGLKGGKFGGDGGGGDRGGNGGSDGGQPPVSEISPAAITWLGSGTILLEDQRSHHPVTVWTK